MSSWLEVAEAMYQAGKDGPGPKMPDSLDELRPHVQARYLLLAEAAITAIPQRVTVVPAPELMVDLAEELAFKLNHPQQFCDRVRDVLARYAEHVGHDHVSDEVRKAMAI